MGWDLLRSVEFKWHAYAVGRRVACGGSLDTGPCRWTLRSPPHHTAVPHRTAGDHLYRMDYREFVGAHRAAGADITVAALPCAEEQAQAFGLMKIDDAGRCAAAAVSCCQLLLSAAAVSCCCCC